MSALRFSANVSWMFPEIPDLSDRIRASATAGFRGVEAAWPYECPTGELRGALSEGRGMEMVLINTPPGDTRVGELGLGAVPGRQDAFRAGLDRAVRLATDLECQRIHIMAGRVPGGLDRESVEKEMEETFVENLRYAADVLHQVFDPIVELAGDGGQSSSSGVAGIVGLIEPINSRITEPRYFLNTPQQAAAILQKVGRENLKMQMDLFHWQIMDGNLTENIRRYFPLIGHVQIAQVPHRHEPDSPGELNFPYLFDLLEELGYQGYVGCEYKPRGDTVAGLGWMQEYHKRREERAESN